MYNKYSAGRYCSYKYAILRVYQGLSAAQLADSNDENMPDQPTDEPSDGEDKNNALQQGDSNEDQLSAQGKLLNASTCIYNRKQIIYYYDVYVGARYANKCGYVKLCSRRGNTE